MSEQNARPRHRMHGPGGGPEKKPRISGERQAGFSGIWERIDMVWLPLCFSP